MIQFVTTIQKFAEKGEKTGWTFIEITHTNAHQLIPNNKKGFRVKGFINQHPIKSLAAIPMGNGGFIIALNNDFRTHTKLKKGDEVNVVLEIDLDEYQINKDLLECLQDDPLASEVFNSLPKSHKVYYSKWIEQAKTPQTISNRITKVMIGLSRKLDFAATIKLKI